MGLNTSKYGTDRNAGIGGLYRTGTSAPAKMLDWAQVALYGGIIIGGGFILMIGYSFASGRQNLAQTVSAAGELAKQGAVLTPMGRAAKIAGAI
jgi:hypothetical protein